MSRYETKTDLENIFGKGPPKMSKFENSLYWDNIFFYLKGKVEYVEPVDFSTAIWSNFYLFLLFNIWLLSKIKIIYRAKIKVKWCWILKFLIDVFV